MSKIAVSQVKSISSLPLDYVSLSKEAEKNGEVVFLNHYAPYVVLVDFDRWQELKKKELLYDTQQAVAAIKQSEKEFTAGKVRRLRSLKDL